MFAFLRGKLQSKAPDAAIVDVGGVGYRLTIPLSTFYDLGDAGAEVCLLVTAQFREDAITLYGFLTAAEQDLFRHLVSVSGVGPRTALAVLSGMPAAEVIRALADGDAARLRTVPGVGKRTAERLIVELKDRAATLAGPAGGPPRAPRDGTRDDVASALVNLGYPAAQAERAADQARESAGAEAPLARLLREALRRLHP